MMIGMCMRALCGGYPAQMHLLALEYLLFRKAFLKIPFGKLHR